MRLRLVTHLGQKPLTVQVDVAPGNFQMRVTSEPLPGHESFIHRDAIAELTRGQQTVLRIEARPDNVKFGEHPVTVTWDPAQLAVDVPALMKDHARLGAELRELTATHEKLLEAVLQNADEDVNGGDEAAEHLAERYVRFLESQLADCQRRLKDGDRAFAVIREILEALCAKHGISLDSTAEPGTPARNYELADRLGIGQVFGLVFGQVFGLSDPPDTGLAREVEAYQQARLLGREIMTGGPGYRGSLYGAVKATYPKGSRVAREDSWQCHHKHPDALSALECALGEVRRLAAGGDYQPCEGGSCPGDECRDEYNAS
jgi:hypothetical protein